MIAVVRVSKFTKIIAGVFFLLFFLLSLYGLWCLFSHAKEAGADRSNALAVTAKNNTNSETEIMPPISSAAAALNASKEAPDFFVEYRLERDKIRSERTDLLRDILKNAHAEETKKQAQNAILQMTLEKQMESEMENLIKAKGFGDALVFIRENSVSAVVKSSSL